MTSGISTIDRRGADTSAVSPAGAVLASAREHRRVANAAEAALLADVLAWCELHITTDPDEGETWGDVPVQLSGAGCPWIREFTITELAAELSLSLPAARALVSDVLELAFRHSPAHRRRWSPYAHRNGVAGHRRWSPPGRHRRLASHRRAEVLARVPARSTNAEADPGRGPCAADPCSHSAPIRGTRTAREHNTITA